MQQQQQFKTDVRARGLCLRVCAFALLFASLVELLFAAISFLASATDTRTYFSFFYFSPFPYQLTLSLVFSFRNNKNKRALLRKRANARLRAIVLKASRGYSTYLSGRKSADALLMRQIAQISNFCQSAISKQLHCFLSAVFWLARAPIVVAIVNLNTNIATLRNTNVGGGSGQKL